MNFDTLLFTIAPEDHTPKKLAEILANHREVRFVSVVGVDLSGHATDEKIPVRELLDDVKAFLQHGVQTDGSAVFLPDIADLSNGRVDLIPDTAVNWYVDYNIDSFISPETACGTLCIPAYLKHNGKTEVGSRHMLKEAENTFKEKLMALLAAHPYVLKTYNIASYDDIEALELTGATELEFWVQTPEDKANREQLSISQELKEQYWKRTTGPVRTALEQTLIYLDYYGIGVEMGHKEVGGIIAKLGASGHYDHIMEQLEIDWRYAGLVQSSDNEYLVKNIVTDVFRKNGLDVTFMAKPVAGVSGSGEHHHLGVCAMLKGGRRVNLFNCYDKKSYLSAIGFGALMGLLKNYEVLNTFIACSNDAMNRLKPGFEAPVCIVTSLGKDIDTPSRNRTVLVGVIRDLVNPLHTRFELRSPCPNCNSYLVFAGAYLAMLDGISAVLSAEKRPRDLEDSISKKQGEPDFYLDQGREYRSEQDVFATYTKEERDSLFGKAPGTVYETFETAAGREAFLTVCPAFTQEALASYEKAVILQWAMELRDRLVPQAMADSSDERKALLAGIVEALDAGDLKKASDLQMAAQRAE